MRVFTLFDAPPENELVWQETGIDGAVRFLQRVWRFVNQWQAVLRTSPKAEPTELSKDAQKLRQKTHQAIKRITENFESYQFNTPVAALMELLNALLAYTRKHSNRLSNAASQGLSVSVEEGFNPKGADQSDLFAVDEALRSLILMLAPFAPHISEELWEIITGREAGILQSGARFPVADETLTRAVEIEIPVQVNGKLRSRLSVAPETAREELEALALADAKIGEYTSGKQIVKIVVVPNRLVNIVVK